MKNKLVNRLPLLVLLLIPLLAIFLFSNSNPVLSHDPWARKIIPVTVDPVACSENAIFYNMTTHKMLICKGLNTIGTVALVGEGTGISSLNAITGTTQTFAVATTGTDFAINSSGTVHTFSIPNASGVNRGLLTSADWTTFNSKQTALGFTPENIANKGATNGYASLSGGKVPGGQISEVLSITDLTDYTTTSGAGNYAIKATITAIQTNDCLKWSGTDWINSATCGGGGGGAPTDATYITQTANGTLSAEQALGLLSTGILKNTTTTGVLSIAVAGTDYLTPSGNGSALTGITFTQIGGSVTDAQVPNTITIDLATLATTASAGDSATSFFSGGTLELGIGGTGVTVSGTSGNVLQSNGSVWVSSAVDFTELTGNATDAQVPNNITVDLATTATTANAGDSATSFFSSGILEPAIGGTGVGSAPAEDQVLVGNGTIYQLKTLPSCSNGVNDKLLYNSTTNVFSCGADQTTGGGSGITSLNTLVAASQTFSKTDDTNVTFTITSSTADHNFALGWTGTLAKARTLAATVYTDQANTFGLFLQKFRSGANFQLSDSTDATKLAQFDLSNITTGTTRTVTVANAASTTVVADTGAANNFLTAISATGVISKAQPTFSNLVAASSATFLAVINDESGTGLVVANDTPTLIGPIISNNATLPTAVLGKLAVDTDDTKLYYAKDGTTWGEVFVAGLSLVNLTTHVTGVLPVANGGTSFSDTTFSGNTHKLVTTTGTLTSGRCAEWDASGNIIQAAAACGSGGTGDVVGPASATDNAIVRFDTGTGKLVQNSAVTIADTTGDISSPGNISLGVGGSVAGFLELTQGTLTSAGTTSVILSAPTSVTSYRMVFPSTAATGFLKVTNSAGVMTMTIESAGGTGTVTNTGGDLTNNALVLGAGTVDTKVSTGLNTNGAARIILGVSGTLNGVVEFFNQTTGSIIIQAPITGALGSSALTLPARTATIATSTGTLTTGRCVEIDASGNFIQAAVTCGNALTSGTLAQFAATTSSEFLGVISNETGSGLVVGNDTPTLIGPVISNNATLPTAALGKLAVDTDNNKLYYASDGSTWNEVFVAGLSLVNLASNVTGDLPFANLTPATAASKLLGRGDSGAGDFQEITIGSGLSMTGTTLSSTGGGAPTTATYITQTADAGLSAEQALSGLSSGIMRVATTTGVITSLTTSVDISNNLSDETGTSGLLVFNSSPTIITPTITGAIAFQDGVRQTFNPDGTNSGLNVGAQAGDPSTPSNGDLWYDSTANELTARINGGNVALGAGGGGSPGGSSTEFQYRSGASTFGGAANFLYTSATGVVTLNQLADTNGLIYGKRFTDTTPTGNFIEFQNTAANADVFQVDVNGNITAAGSLGVGIGSSVAGNIELTQGTAPSLGTTAITLYAPTSVTSYAIVYPSAAASGIPHLSNSSNIMTMTISAVSLTADITGTLAVGNGGSGATTLTGILKGNGTSAFTAAIAGTDYTSPTGTETLTNKRINPRVNTFTPAATWSPNADTDDYFVVNGQNVAVTTISNPSGTPVNGQKMVFRIEDDGTARAISGWGTQYRFSSDLPAPTTTTATKVMYLGFIYSSLDTKWDLVSKLDNF